MGKNSASKQKTTQTFTVLLHWPITKNPKKIDWSSYLHEKRIFYSFTDLGLWGYNQTLSFLNSWLGVENLKISPLNAHSIKLQDFIWWVPDVLCVSRHSQVRWLTPGFNAPRCSTTPALPEVSLVFDSSSYLHSAYSEADRTDTGRRTNHTYWSRWIIEIAESKRSTQPLRVTWQEWWVRQQRLQIRQSFRLGKNVICSHVSDFIVMAGIVIW